MKRSAQQGHQHVGVDLERKNLASRDWPGPYSAIVKHDGGIESLIEILVDRKICDYCGVPGHV
jgi:hypothetical protein